MNKLFFQEVVLPCLDAACLNPADVLQIKSCLVYGTQHMCIAVIKKMINELPAFDDPYMPKNLCNTIEYNQYNSLYSGYVARFNVILTARKALYSLINEDSIETILVLFEHVKRFQALVILFDEAFKMIQAQNGILPETHNFEASKYV